MESILTCLNSSMIVEFIGVNVSFFTAISAITVIRFAALSILHASAYDQTNRTAIFFATFSATHVGDGGPVPPTNEHTNTERQACRQRVLAYVFSGNHESSSLGTTWTWIEKITKGARQNEIHHAHYTFSPQARDKAIQRFKESGGTPPEGIKMHGRWHATSGNEGSVLSETDDAKAQMEWVMAWSDLLDFTITPVGDDAEFTEVIGRAT